MEEWKDIPGYDEYYQASNFGRIRSKDRIIKRTRNLKKHEYYREGRTLKPHVEGSGYWQVLIIFPGFRKHMKVHRLAAFAWLPNPLNKKCINHKDGNKANNCISNLEWVTHGENLVHAHLTGLKKPQQLGKRGRLHTRSQPVLSINQTAIIEHESKRLCAEYLRVDPSAIQQAVKKGHTCRGHKIYAL